jgi:Tol biopolymer transport system component
VDRVHRVLRARAERDRQVEGGRTGRKELTPWALNANNAKWSPDGSQIAFNSHNDPSSGGEANLYTMRPDGSGLVQITHYTDGKLNAYLGGWSPDGKHLVFHLRGPDPNAPGVNQLFVVDADGSNARQLTHLPHGANPGYASWSPAG